MTVYLIHKGADGIEVVLRGPGRRERVVAAVPGSPLYHLIEAMLGTVANMDHSHVPVPDWLTLPEPVVVPQQGSEKSQEG